MKLRTLLKIRIFGTYTGIPENMNSSFFPDAEVTLYLKPGKLPKLLVKILSTPVQSLVDASISEKKRMASEIFREFHDFIEFMEFPLDDLKIENADQVQEG